MHDYMCELISTIGKVQQGRMMEPSKARSTLIASRIMESLSGLVRSKCSRLLDL